MTWTYTVKALSTYQGYKWYWCTSGLLRIYPRVLSGFILLITPTLTRGNTIPNDFLWTAGTECRKHAYQVL